MKSFQKIRKKEGGNDERFHFAYDKILLSKECRVFVINDTRIKLDTTILQLMVTTNGLRHH